MNAWMEAAARLPSATALTTSLPPLAQSPPAYQPGRDVAPPSSTTTRPASWVTPGTVSFAWPMASRTSYAGTSKALPFEAVQRTAETASSPTKPAGDAFQTESAPSFFAASHSWA